MFSDSYTEAANKYDSLDCRFAILTMNYNVLCIYLMSGVTVFIRFVIA